MGVLKRVKLCPLKSRRAWIPAIVFVWQARAKRASMAHRQATCTFRSVKQHPIFEREGNNLYCEVPINFAMAALGGEIEVPTLDGRVMLKVPSETQTGKLFRMRGKGVKSVRGGAQGDLLCRVVVETPVGLSENRSNC